MSTRIFTKINDTELHIGNTFYGGVERGRSFCFIPDQGDSENTRESTDIHPGDKGYAMMMLTYWNMLIDDDTPVTDIYGFTLGSWRQFATDLTSGTIFLSDQVVGSVRI